MKKGFIYCYTPSLCEIEVICIDIAYNYKSIQNCKAKNEINICKMIYNPNIIKNKLFKKYKKFNLINNIFSYQKKEDIIKDIIKS
jgi:hypothetical protein|uniref:Uncharacterized protein n=1 Tax=viral metagenome TaxID=1070528 RepID=A0A6C0JQQ3_9ZZZZ|tara:strand:+ start:23745 stop:23999 length:255 start_codon:yes stop_codon:yes gene_type:complete